MRYLLIILSLGILSTQIYGARKPSSIQLPADYYKHEILLSSTESQLLISGNTNFTLQAGYNYGFNSFLQFGGVFSIAVVEVSNISLTTFKLTGGATLNLPFEAQLQDAFFTGLQLGIVHSSAASASATELEIDLSVGKRFKLFDHLCYRPSLGLSIITGGNDVVFKAEFLSASVHF